VATLKKIISFFEERMSVNIECFKSSLQKECTSNEKKEIFSVISEMITEVERNPNQPNILDDPSNNEIYRIYEKSASNNTQMEPKLDALRHAFTSFLAGGLHDLFCYQENDGWYLPIELTKVLEPNTIHELDDTIKIYRGCSINEFEDNNCRQSWTTDAAIAQLFAFSHYTGAQWFDPAKRVILSAYIDKEHVFFARSHESEIVVNSNNLRNIEKTHNVAKGA
jgi:hypothetical protein